MGGVKMLPQIQWTPIQVAVFRREILRETCRKFARHFTRENGDPVSWRTVQGWEATTRVRRPEYFVRMQLTLALLGLAAHKLNKHLWEVLPPTDEE